MTLFQRIALRPKPLIAIGALLALSWLAARLVLTSPALSYELKLALLTLIALLFSLLALAGIDRIIRQRSRPGLMRIIPLAVFLLAYLVPLLLFVFPDWSGLSAASGARGWQVIAAGQPWTFLWQALLLLGFVISQRFQPPADTLQADARSAPAASPWFKSIDVKASSVPAIIGILSGLCLWLLGMFSHSYLAAWIDPGLPGRLSPFLERTVFIVALLAAPLGEEYFFRGYLSATLQALFKGAGSALVVAVLFATLQFRPLLWLPAFVLSLGLALLVRWSGRLYPAVIAHIIYNALMLALGWYMVV